MSVDVVKTKLSKLKRHKRHGDQAEDVEHKSKRKRHTAGSSQSIEDAPKKRHRSDKAKQQAETVAQQLTDPNSSDGSPFHQQSSSLYLPLSPICQLLPLEGLCAEHLSPLILTYYPPFQGIILSYSNPRLSEEPGRYGNEGSQDPALALSVDEFAVSFVWVTVDFLVFKPQRGGWIDGWINIQNESHLGIVCWNLFNASIERRRLPREWKWIGVTRKSKTKLKPSQEEIPSEEVEDTKNATHAVEDVREDEGHFEDAEGNKVEGSLRFRVRDIDASMSMDRERSFLSIEGSLLSDVDEEAYLQQERLLLQTGTRRLPFTSGREAPVMSGALLFSEINSDVSEGRQIAQTSNREPSH